MHIPPAGSSRVPRFRLYILFAALATACSMSSDPSQQANPTTTEEVVVPKSAPADTLNKVTIKLSGTPARTVTMRVPAKSITTRNTYAGLLVEAGNGFRVFLGPGESVAELRERAQKHPEKLTIVEDVQNGILVEVNPASLLPTEPAWPKDSNFSSTAEPKISGELRCDSGGGRTMKDAKASLAACLSIADE